MIDHPQTVARLSVPLFKADPKCTTLQLVSELGEAEVADQTVKLRMTTSGTRLIFDAQDRSYHVDIHQVVDMALAALERELRQDMSVAFCWASGKIETAAGTEAPKNARLIVCAPLCPQELRARLSPYVRHAWSGEFLVPGVPEEDDQSRKLAAFERWHKRIRDAWASGAFGGEEAAR